MESAHRRVNQLLARQFGVITRQQAMATGLTARQIENKLKNQEWVAQQRGVYRSAVVPLGRDQRSIAALLKGPPGTTFSHFSAARIHGLDIRPGSSEVWVTIPHECRREAPEGTRLFRSRRIADFTVVVGGKPVTSVARTLLDLGRFLKTRTLRGTVYDALRTQMCTVEDLHEAARSSTRNKSKNSLIQILRGFDPAHDSGLEAEAGEIFARHGINLVRQYQVVVEGRIIRRFDFAVPDLKVAVEIDGAAYHASTEAQERDRQADQKLAELGWITLRFTASDVRQRPQEMVHTIREVLSRRARHA